MNTRRRPLWQVSVVLALGTALMLGFAALGWWQVERRAWKHDLIARVETRIHAAPVPMAALDGLMPEDLEYRRVSVTGRFDPDREVLVTAVTELGGGYWVLAPLTSGNDRTVLVNRGFVPPEMRDPHSRAGPPRDPITVTGLARLSEPGGAFLRQNDPEAGRWYSRDTDAISAALNLGPTAAFFIDADARSEPDVFPAGGLTVVRFRDTHLVYALTWFALAAMVAGGLGVLIRSELQVRRPPLLNGNST